MANYKVTQVNGETSGLNEARERRSITVDESRVDFIKTEMRHDMRTNPAHSSDWVKVTPA